jgi:metal-responsive CopG/Arc/MetJ family transcriptional regulator
MRNIVNISLPAEMNKKIKEAAKKGHYASTSEFMRSLIRAWMDKELLIEVNESRKEFTSGNLLLPYLCKKIQKAPKVCKTKSYSPRKTFSYKSI